MADTIPSSSAAVPRAGGSTLRRLGRALALPGYSGKKSVALLLVIMIASACMLFRALHWPVWVEAEVSVGVWWLCWGLTLSHILYSGRHVEDDHQFDVATWEGTRHAVATSWVGKFFKFGQHVVFDIELGLVWLGASLAGLFLVVASWIVTSAIIPGVAALAYMLVHGMMAHAVNRPHDCQGRAFRSLGGGFFWSFVYALPLSAAVFLLHVLASRAGG